MKSLSTFWIPSPDFKYTNFGDILTPFILNKFKINAIYDPINPKLYGIGSILHTIPDDYKGYIWTSGMMYNTKTINLLHDPIALRGKLTLKQFTTNDTTNTVLGDGGLILEQIYKPKIKHRYKLGIMPNYVDIVNMTDNPIQNFDIFNRPDVLFIDSRDYIETVVSNICSCDHIISSSLHGLVVADSYKINNGIFCSRETKIAIHHLQDAFKFRDYYSVFDINFDKNQTTYFNNNTTFEQCLSICKPFNKPNLGGLKYGLVQSIDKITSICE